MVLKKKIKVNPRNTSDEQGYNHLAGICPICGTDVTECYQLTDAADQRILYIVARKKVTSFCPTCGCSWSVKLFKKNNSEARTKNDATR